MSDNKKWLTVSELANRYNKSESTIKRLVKKLQSMQASAVRHEGKKIFVCAEYLPLIMTDHDRPMTDHEPKMTDHVSDTVKNELERELAETKERERQRLEQMIETLERELAEKNKQIERLTTTVENLTTASEFQNQLLDNLRLQIRTPALPPKKLNWWQRLFKK